MREEALAVRPVDFGNARDSEQYLTLLDTYASDPMGAGSPLPCSVRERLVTDLAGHPGAYCLLAEHGDEAVGFATCFLGYSTFRARPLLNIHDIAVSPGWRGKNVARHLLAAISELGRQLECCRVTLEVREDNPRARKVYESAGFAPAQCSLFMEKPL
jgi:ribosomal protein S18 acetylase RimI-like enzyme